MTTQLNTLYVMTQGSWISKEGECIEVRNSTGRKLLPIHMISGGIVTFGNVIITPFLMGHCAKHGIHITCLTENGRYLASINAGTRGNVFLRKHQFRSSENFERSAQLATFFLIGKLANTRVVLRRAARERGGFSQLSNAADTITLKLKRLQTSTFTLDELRGLEGDAAAHYFSVFRYMIQPSGFDFIGRSKHPPTDSVNALLSFMYVLLSHDCTTAIESVGLDPQIGFLHRDRSGRSSLALDLMEELRALFVDRLVIKLLNLKQLTEKNFIHEPTGAVKITENTRKTILSVWQERKKNTIQHPYTHENISLGLVPFIQASLLARYLRGDADGYPPFIWK